MFSLFGGGAPAPKKDHTVSPEELNEIHRKWAELQNGHRQSLEGLLSKLVDENAAIKTKLAQTEQELKMWKAGSAEDQKELKKLRTELKRLRGGDIDGGALSVVILDFELDLFTPALFHRPAHAGRLAARAIRDKVKGSLPDELDGSVVNVMVFVFLTRKRELIADLIAEGLISSPRELDEFIASFNRAHPLYMLIDTPDPREISLQRQRALATIFTRFSQCRRLVLGRWALDLELMEMVSPSRMKPTDDAEKKPKFDDKIHFVEPFPGTWVPPHFRSREPKTIDMKGVLRKVPLRRGRGQLGAPKLNLNRGLHQQDPPICLDHYLLPDRCSRESCHFCHAYALPPSLVEELRHQIASTPCAIVADGFACDSECLFAHICPRKLRCKRYGCDFGPHMHPPLPPPPSPHAMHHMGTPRGQHPPFTDTHTPPLASAIPSVNPNAVPISPSRTSKPFIPRPGVSGSLPASPTKPANLGTAIATSLPASPAAPLPATTSPLQPRPSPRSIQSWTQGVTSPGDHGQPYPIAEPPSQGQAGPHPTVPALEQAQQTYANSIDQEFAEMTDEQFEAYAAQLAKEEEEMLAAMSPSQRSKVVKEGWDQDDDGYQYIPAGVGKAESVLFDDGKGKKAAPSKGIWTGRKSEGVV